VHVVKNVEEFGVPGGYEGLRDVPPAHRDRSVTDIFSCILKMKHTIGCILRAIANKRLRLFRHNVMCRSMVYFVYLTCSCIVCKWYKLSTFLQDFFCVPQLQIAQRSQWRAYIWNHYRSTEWYHRWPPTTAPSSKMGLLFLQAMSPFAKLAYFGPCSHNTLCVIKTKLISINLY